MTGLTGGIIGYVAGRGAKDQGWLLGLVGLIAGLFLAGQVLRLIGQVGELGGRRRWPARRMDETDPGPDPLLAGGTPDATVARFAAMDGLVTELVPDELAALPQMLDPT